MEVDRLWLHNFRSYEDLEVSFDKRLNLVIGDNGNGKTNLIEAIAYLARLSSFRGSPSSALIRQGEDSGFVRAEVTTEGRQVLIEAEISSTGRSQVFVNKQKVGRVHEILESLNVTIFAPDDLELVKGAPSGRRDFLDQTLISLHRKNAQAKSDYEKNLRQRNALLKQMGGRSTEETLITLDVWDQRVAESGERLAGLRQKCCERMVPLLETAYEIYSGSNDKVDLNYVSEWSADGLLSALSESREQEIRRGLSLCGPHRDELSIMLSSMPARTHASQGEQRCLALGLRLASHQLILQATGTAPVLLLDDVFSELDHKRSKALTDSLPPGQTVVTTATEIPSLDEPQRLIRISESKLVE